MFRWGHIAKELLGIPVIVDPFVTQLLPQFLRQSRLLGMDLIWNRLKALNGGSLWQSTGGGELQKTGHGLIQQRYQSQSFCFPLTMGGIPY